MLNALNSISPNFFNAFKPTVKDGSAANFAAGSEIKQQAAQSNNFIENFWQSSTKDKPSQQNMEARLNDIKYRGKLLMHHPLKDSVKSYVKDIKEFLGDLKEHAYGSRYKDDLFQRIDIVDSNLDKLSDEFLTDQQKELSLVNSLGELQGLLVDVYA